MIAITGIEGAMGILRVHIQVGGVSDEDIHFSIYCYNSPGIHINILFNFVGCVKQMAHCGPEVRH